MPASLAPPLRHKKYNQSVKRSCSFDIAAALTRMKIRIPTNLDTKPLWLQSERIVNHGNLFACYLNQAIRVLCLKLGHKIIKSFRRLEMCRVHHPDR